MNLIQFTRIKRDINGNSRHVCHFTNLLSTDEALQNKLGVMRNFELALKRAKKLGGKEYKAKWYGGGIVFQTNNLADLEKRMICLWDSTEVKFYIEKNGDILAVFPEIEVTGDLLVCYSHVGQHSRASKSYLRYLKRANSDQYINLYTELKSVGYKLDVI